jgi:hypothetical protein
MIKIFTVAHVPEELHKAWLQHLRDFDAAHPECHFEIMADAPKASIAEMVEVLRVSPGLTWAAILERGE